GTQFAEITMRRLPCAPQALKVIENALSEARNLGDDFIGSEHLLLGLLREPENVAAQVLMNLGVKLEDLRQEVMGVLGHGYTDKRTPLQVMASEQEQPHDSGSAPNFAASSDAPQSRSRWQHGRALAGVAGVITLIVIRLAASGFVHRAVNPGLGQ